MTKTYAVYTFKSFADAQRYERSRVLIAGESISL